jgi:hypothetical protein
VEVAVTKKINSPEPRILFFDRKDRMGSVRLDDEGFRRALGRVTATMVQEHFSDKRLSWIQNVPPEVITKANEVPVGKVTITTPQGKTHEVNVDAFHGKVGAFRGKKHLYIRVPDPSGFDTFENTEHHQWLVAPVPGRFSREELDLPRRIRGPIERFLDGPKNLDQFSVEVDPNS